MQLPSDFPITRNHLVARARILEKVKGESKSYPILEGLLRDFGPSSVDYIGLSRSQLFQDLWVLAISHFKTEGYFVEIGACDGEKLSNTFLLEREFRWAGILAEPARTWHEELGKRRDAKVDHRCVWSSSGGLVDFVETTNAVLSTVASLADGDLHSDARKHGEVYEVETVSLDKLLTDHNAPASIDYLSIDTEGSEFEILAQLDFTRWSFGAITVEHNNTGQRQKISDLLRAAGYRRWRPDVTKFDDWYWNPNYVEGRIFSNG